jgi:hypothetical protein
VVLDNSKGRCHEYRSQDRDARVRPTGAGWCGEATRGRGTSGCSLQVAVYACIRRLLVDSAMLSNPRSLHITQPARSCCGSRHKTWQGDPEQVGLLLELSATAVRWHLVHVQPVDAG